LYNQLLTTAIPLIFIQQSIAALTLVLGGGRGGRGGGGRGRGRRGEGDERKGRGRGRRERDEWEGKKREGMREGKSEGGRKGLRRRGKGRVYEWVGQIFTSHAGKLIYWLFYIHPWPGFTPLATFRVQVV
jgi:hypothetical protein